MRQILIAIVLLVVGVSPAAAQDFGPFLRELQAMRLAINNLIAAMAQDGTAGEEAPETGPVTMLTTPDGTLVRAAGTSDGATHVAAPEPLPVEVNNFPLPLEVRPTPCTPDGFVSTNTTNARVLVPREGVLFALQAATPTTNLYFVNVFLKSDLPLPTDVPKWRLLVSRVAGNLSVDLPEAGARFATGLAITVTTENGGPVPEKAVLVTWCGQ